MAQHYLQLSSILKKLLYDHQMRPTDLAHATNLPLPTIHRLVTGKSTRPYLSSLEPIAHYFSIDVEQLLGERPLSSTDDAPTGSHAIITQVPLIAWEKISSRDNWKGDTYIPFLGPFNKTGFATTMPDSSMEPLIPRNALLVFNPELTPIDRSYILIKLHESNRYVLRELLIDSDDQYLKPLNPDLSTFKMKLLSKDDIIIACLVEMRHTFPKGQHKQVLEEKNL